MIEVFQKLPQSVPGTLITAAVSGLVLVLVKLLNSYLGGSLPVPIPGELLTVCIGMAGWGDGPGRQRGSIPTMWASLNIGDL